MTNKPVLPKKGGTYIRQKDGSLKRIDIPAATEQESATAAPTTAPVIGKKTRKENDNELE